MALTNISESTEDMEDGTSNQSKSESNFGKERRDLRLKEFKLILSFSIKALGTGIPQPLSSLLGVVQTTFPIATPGFKAKCTTAVGGGGAPPVWVLPLLGV